MKFMASIVEADINNNIANLLFADPETDPDMPSVLSFSKAMDIKDSDYYFEVNDQSNSSYGGLEAVRLSRGKIEVKLKQELVDKFGEEDFLNIEVGFDADEKTFQSIVETLHKIFDGHGVLEVL
jgi:hypothetical protein